jgi:spermidine synthase
VTRPWETLARVATAEGALELRRRGDDDFLIVIDGRVLMTSAAHRSEDALARFACAKIPKKRAPRILLGGLGMGYTLRAALDALPAAASVVVAELNPTIVDWCRGPLVKATSGAVEDQRVIVQVGDVAAVISASSPATWDAIVLDLYEGPHAAAQSAADPFYGPAAIARTRAALAKGGVFAVWSEEADARFEKTLSASGFGTIAKHRVGGGRAHIVYIAQ